MLKCFLKYATLLAVATTSLSYADCQTTFEIGVGYRRDFTKWNLETIDTLGNNISIENRLKDENIFLIDARAKMIEDWFYFRANADYGWITSGKFHNNFEVAPLAGSPVDDSFHNKIKGGSHVADVTAAIGYPFEFCCGDFILAPVVGYAYHYKRIETKNHFRPLTGTTVVFAPIDGHKNKLSASWYGPLLGADVFWRIDDCWNLWGEFQYIFAQCKRKWESDFGIPSINHHSRRKTAYGFDGTVGTDYFFTCDWYAGLSVDFKYWRTKKGGHHRFSDVEAGEDLPISDRVNWTSVGVNLNAGYLF